MLRHWLSRLLVILGCGLVLLGAIYGGMVGYLSWREQVSPSTRQVLLLKDGREISLVQPTIQQAAIAMQPERAPSEPTGGAAGVAHAAASTSAPTVASLLPPARIAIPGIGLDWPVVLSDNEHLPRFKGVGWLMGSAFPGVAGNIVLFGHLDGPYGTFMRLHELQPGDEFSVFTAEAEYRYRVRSSYETTPDDVAALAPTDSATATLITCSGPWDPVAQTNERRLIVTADYIGPQG